MRYFLLILLLAATQVQAQTFYVVRHAEKELADSNARSMQADPPLSKTGKQRAQDLKAWMQGKGLTQVYSTNYERTRATVQPSAAAAGITIQLYSPRPDSTNALIERLHQLDAKAVVLIAGHSNTIDDLANKLTGRTVVPGDLPETEYNNLYVIRKEGEGYSFTALKYGEPANFKKVLRQ